MAQKKIPSLKHLRSEALRLFPAFSSSQQEAWAKAKRRVMGGTWTHPVGDKHEPDPNHVPIFLRRAPPGSPLEIATTTRDRVVRVKQMTRRVFGRWAA